MQVSWQTLKSFTISKDISIQYIDLGDSYFLQIHENSFDLNCLLMKDGGADVIDFETNFMSSGNQPIINRVEGNLRAAQDGTWNMNNISGTISLPTGASTSELQNTINSSIQSINTKLSDKSQLTKITGSDGLYTAAVDSVGRVATNANITFPEVIYRVDNLRRDGSPTGSKSMNVNDGAASFRFQPNLNSLTNTYYIEQITIQLEDQGDFLGTSFGALSSLSNGVTINVKSKGQTFRLCLLQDNSDIYTTFSEFPGSQSIAVLLQSNRNMFFGTMTLQNRITLDPALGDYIEAVINDNLTELNTLSMRVSTWRLLG